MNEAELEAIVADLRTSKRYRDVAEPLLRRVVETEARKYAARDVAKAARRHLHRIYGAYLPTRPRFSRLLGQLREAKMHGEAAVRETVLRLMTHHASTRERVRVMDAFMTEINERLSPVETVLDLACGLQPLAAPWWRAHSGMKMIALDIDEAMLDFVADALDILDVDHDVGVIDLHAESVTLPRADVVLMLKTIPCLLPELSGSILELLQRISAPAKVVSFPTRSLGGHSKGMRTNYARRFEAELAEFSGTWERFEVSGELVYIVRAEGAAPESVSS